MGVFQKDAVIFCSILNFGKGSQILKLSKELGGIRNTIFLGKGSVSTEWLVKLGFTDVRKEVFVSLVPKDLEDHFYEEMTQKFGLDKPHHGIAFSIPLSYFWTIEGGEAKSSLGKGGENVSHQCIFVIVNKGLSPEVLEAAEKGGSTGGTVIHGRGSGTQEKARLFNIEIEPEKDIVLILSEKEKTQKIVDSIAKALDIQKPNRGVIFVVEVSRTLGLYRE